MHHNRSLLRDESIYCPGFLCRHHHSLIFVRTKKIQRERWRRRRKWVPTEQQDRFLLALILDIIMSWQFPRRNAYCHAQRWNQGQQHILLLPLFFLLLLLWPSYPFSSARIRYIQSERKCQKMVITRKSFQEERAWLFFLTLSSFIYNAAWSYCATRWSQLIYNKAHRGTRPPENLFSLVAIWWKCSPRSNLYLSTCNNKRVQRKNKVWQICLVVIYIAILFRDKFEIAK